VVGFHVIVYGWPTGTTSFNPGADMALPEISRLFKTVELTMLRLVRNGAKNLVYIVFLARKQ